MEFIDLITKRRSASVFDPNGSISRTDIEKIIEAAEQAPSSYNLQHWHFLVIEEKTRRDVLKKIAFDQQKVADSAAVIVVLGNLAAHKTCDIILNDQVEKGYLPETELGQAQEIISSYYAIEKHQREEAIRGASLTAMIMLLAAENLGYGSCPMGGFDREQLREEYQIPNHLLPIFMIPVGPVLEDSRPQKMRHSVEKVTTYNRFDR